MLRILLSEWGLWRRHLGVVRFLLCLRYSIRPFIHPIWCPIYALSLSLLRFALCFPLPLRPTGRHPLVSPFLCNGGCIILLLGQCEMHWNGTQRSGRQRERAREREGGKGDGEGERGVEGDCPCRVLFVHLLFTKEWACCLLLCSHCNTYRKIK